MKYKRSRHIKPRVKGLIIYKDMKGRELGPQEVFKLKPNARVQAFVKDVRQNKVERIGTYPQSELIFKFW